MEQPQGMHGIEGVHFLGLCRMRGKESWKFGFVVRWGNLRAS
jgi:hypothetical protein